VKKVSFADMHCSIAQSLEVIGEWWTLLILRDAFLGVTRFDDFARRLGIARNVLTARLDTLVDNGVLVRVPYDEARGRFDYRLTAKGRALLPVLTAIRQWGDEWLLGEEAAPIVVEHTTCGHVSKGVLTCDHCHEELTTRTLRARRGPGFREDAELLPADA
jgi:DNA-binding HxlR family transcriptional regulator